MKTRKAKNKKPYILPPGVEVLDARIVGPDADRTMDHIHELDVELMHRRAFMRHGTPMPSFKEFRAEVDASNAIRRQARTA